MKMLTVLIAVAVGSTALGALPPSERQSFTEASSKPKLAKWSEVQKILKKPLKERLSALVNLGPSGYLVLKTMALDEAETNEQRWRALSAMAHIGKREAWPEVERALVDKNWFMRSCALKSLTLIDKEKALVWARQLFEKDPALVVRLSALEVLYKLDDRRSLSLLWNKLNDKDSFYQKRSLFIRSHTAKVLKAWAQLPDSSKFMALLDDADPAVQSNAVMALEKIHGVKLGSNSTQSTLKAQLWKNWALQEKSSSLR